MTQWPITKLASPDTGEMTAVKCDCGWPAMPCDNKPQCQYHGHSPFGGWIHIGTGSHFCATNAVIEYRRKQD